MTRTFRVGRFVSIAVPIVGILLSLIGVLLLIWEQFMNEYGFLRDYPSVYLLSLLMIVFGVLISGFFLFRGFSNPEEEGRDLVEYDRKLQLRQESDSERWGKIRSS